MSWSLNWGDYLYGCSTWLIVDSGRERQSEGTAERVESSVETETGDGEIK